MLDPIGKAIQLSHTWCILSFIAKGGLGAVYKATSEQGIIHALKLIPKAPGANRELLFGDDLSNATNVIPVVDSGEWGDHLVVVMPLAEESLRGQIEQYSVPAPYDTVEILADIATALESLEASGVVHRDIKPDNILYYNGRWCLADFGISRYADSTTAPDTRKFARTPAYAAPEQWRDETATIKTDIYALGVVGYELLTGETPFQGTPGELREQHLNTNPPLLDREASFLHQIIAACLLKPAGARPSPATLLAQLDKAYDSLDHSPANISLLQQANSLSIQRKAEESRIASIAESEAQRRDELYDTACVQFDYIIESIEQLVITNTTELTKDDSGKKIVFYLNEGELGIQRPQLSSQVDGQPFDVIAEAAIYVKMKVNQSGFRGYEGRSHSLWYCDAQKKDEYRWFETAFMAGPFGSQPSTVPFALGLADGISALRPGIGGLQCAWAFTAIDQDKAWEFVQQWINWFAMSTIGQLQRPSRLPEYDNVLGSWRI